MDESLTPLNPLESLPVFEQGLLLVFLCVLAAYIIYAVIFHYHWRQYSTNTRMTTITFITFAVTTLPLVLLLGILTLFA